MKRETYIHDIFFLCFYLYQSSKIKKLGTIGDSVLFWRTVLKRIRILFRILDLKAVSQGMQPPFPHKSGLSLWFETELSSQTQAIGLTPGSVPIYSP